MVITLPALNPTMATGASLGRTSFILHERASWYEWEGECALSIKSVVSGRMRYHVGSAQHVIDSSSYLILNHDQPYGVSLDTDREMESFCVFFQAGFVEDVWRSLVTSHRSLLDQPDQSDQAPLYFYERVYTHDDVLSPALFRLRSELTQRQHDAAWLTERLHDLAQHLLDVHTAVRREVESLPALRAATREELYRRLYLARD